MSLAVVPAVRNCGAGAAAPETLPVQAVTAGSWAHVEPPTSIPAWIDCAGISGVEAYSSDHDNASSPRADILVRSVAFPDSRRASFAVVVDLPVQDTITRQLRRDTGVEMKGATVSVSGGSVNHAVKPIEGRHVSTAGLSTPAQAGGGIFSNLPSLLEYRDWDSGESGTLILSTQLSVGELYERISSAQGLVSRSSSQALLLILFVIGGLFILIEVMALGTGLALAKSITGSVHELFTGTERVRRGDFTTRLP